MIQKDQVRLYQMILAGLHAFFGGFGVLIGLTGLLIPFGILALTAFDVMESLKYALEDPSYFSYWLEGMMGRLTVVAIVAAIATLPSAVAIASGAVGLGTAYGLYARKPWVKFLAIAAALDCVMILGIPFGLFGIFGIGLGIATLLLVWQPEGAAELNDGPPGMPTGPALTAASPAAPAAAPAPPALESAPPPPAAPAPPEAQPPPPPPSEPVAPAPPPPPPDPTDPPKTS